jgi:FecR protein
LSKLDSILKQNAEIKDFKVYDTQMEWDLFLEKVEAATSPSIPSINEQKETKFFTLFNVAKSIAAVFMVVFFCIWTLKKPENNRSSITAAAGQSLELADGSIIVSKGAKLDYPTTFTGQENRTIYLDGNAEFDVKRSILPFYVYAGKLKVDVVGTKFNISQSKDTINIENKEGVVKVSEIANPENKVTLYQGDKYQYINGQFKDLNVKVIVEIPDTTIVQEKVVPKTTVKEEKVTDVTTPTVVESGSTYKLGSVLKDYILKQNKKVVKIDKKFKYDPEMRVKLNLNLPYQELINNLKNKGIIDTQAGECEGCIIIVAPGSKG